MRFRDLTIVSKTVLISTLLVWGVITYWMFYPYEPITITSPLIILNDNKTVFAGGVLRYQLDIEKHLRIPCVVARQLQNDIIITYSPIVSDLSIGKVSKEIPMIIPEYAPVGKYKLKWDAIYQVNPIRTVQVTVYSEEFYVR